MIKDEESSAPVEFKTGGCFREDLGPLCGARCRASEISVVELFLLSETTDGRLYRRIGGGIRRACL